MRRLLIYVIIPLILVSCSDPLGVENNVRITPIIKPSKLDFGNLKLGQRAKFTFFEINAGSYVSTETKKLYQGDTLVMEVCSKALDGWIFREYIIKGFYDGPDNVLRMDELSDTLSDTVYYKVNIKNNEFIAWMDGGNYFNSYMFKASGEVRFSLDEYTDTLVTMSFWGTPFFNSPLKKGYLLDFHHKLKTYDRINILETGDNTKDILSNLPLQVQIFSKKYGIVQRIMFHRTNNYRETIGYGWDIAD